MVKLLTLLWLFNASQPPQSMLTAQAPQAEFAAPADTTGGFTVKFTVDLKKFDGEKTILEVPGVLGVRLRQHDPRDRNRQNYPAFKMPDGSVPVLEATVVLHSAEHPDWRNMIVGIPLAMLKKPEGRHEVVLNFTGVRWTMYVDGELLDNDFPFGYPQWAEKNAWKLDPEYVKEAAIYLPAIKPEKKEVQPFNTSPNIQYWTPPGHNSWVGDVVTFFYKGRYHVFYLYDRRHHQSKFGCGSHYFEHLSTKDFKTWTEHEAATPLEEQWETQGTGTPFVFNDKLYLSYGLHTMRVYPDNKMIAAQWEYLNKNGRTGAFKRAATTFIPAGATYAVSEDGGSSFRKSWIIFHPSQNPSVYTDPSGKLRMLANFGSNGIWASESVDGGWHCINPGFPPGSDCTFFFRWSKFDYILGASSRLWSKPAHAPISAYEDMATKGLDFYDGSLVPSVTAIADGRFLSAGWISIHGGWGGCLVIHELVQFPDGRIGSKWMEEITPRTETSKTLAASVAETAAFPTGGESFLLSFDVQPTEAKNGKFGVLFLPDSGEQVSWELQLRPGDGRAQFGPGSLSGFAGNEKTLRERGCEPTAVGNYAIENLIGVDKPFTVRVIVKGDEKLGGSLIDAEIAGQRTMISYRPDLTVKKMVFRTEGVELKNVQLAPLKK